MITAASIENVNQFCGFTASFRIDVIIAKREREDVGVRQIYRQLVGMELLIP